MADFAQEQEQEQTQEVQQSVPEETTQASAPEASTDQAASTPASGESVPAEAAANQAGSSEVATRERTPEETEKDAKDGYGIGKDILKFAKDAKKGFDGLKPGLGGLVGLKDAYGSGKEAIEAAQKGENGTAAEKGIDAAGSGAKAILPALAKVLPSVAKALPGVGAGITGAQLGAKVGNYGDEQSAGLSLVQRGIRGLGLGNADGSPTTITDAQRNLGDSVEAKTGSHALGTATKIASAVPAAVPIIASAGAGAVKSGWNYLKNKASSLLNTQDG
jgi:hypothetical protein